MTVSLPARGREFLFLFTSFFALTACTMGSGLHPDAAIPDLSGIEAGKEITSAAVSSAPVLKQWRTVYGDAQLNSLITDALRITPSMAEAQARLWVDANFKEIQLRGICPGQPATVTADVCGRKVRYHGIVQGLASFMAVVDITIANVSVPTISGDLGVSTKEGEGLSPFLL